MQAGSGAPTPPAQRGRKPKEPGGRKRVSKKAAEAGVRSATPDAGAAGAAGGRKPGRKPGSAGRGGGRGRGRGKAGEDDDLDLVQPEARAVDEEPEEKLGKTHEGVFARDLPWLMYGFGDADQPLKETVELVEDVAVQFITDTVHAAMAAAAARNPGGGAGAGGGSRRDELRLEDLLYAVRADPRKVARVQELIRRHEEIKSARRVLNAEAEGLPEDMPE